MVRADAAGVAAARAGVPVRRGEASDEGAWRVGGGVAVGAGVVLPGTIGVAGAPPQPASRTRPISAGMVSIHRPRLTRHRGKVVAAWRRRAYTCSASCDTLDTDLSVRAGDGMLSAGSGPGPMTG